MKVRKYKIHSVDVARGITRAMGNDKFYDNVEKATAKATEYAQNSGKAMVIYEAILVVTPIKPPVEVTRL